MGVTDIPPLNSSTLLKHVDLNSCCDIVDSSPLSICTKLERFIIFTCPVEFGIDIMRPGVVHGMDDNS
jgi:hypothetical protein